MEQPTTEKKHSPTPFLIIGAILLVLLLAGGTAVILKVVKPNQQDTTGNPALQAKADFDKAQQSLIKGDLSAAQSSYEKAKSYYKQTKDSSKLKEIEAALSLIKHSQTVSSEEPKEHPPAAKSE